MKESAEEDKDGSCDRQKLYGGDRHLAACWLAKGSMFEEVYFTPGKEAAAE